MKIAWKQERWLPVFIKGGAMGIVDGAPVYAAGCTYPWRETEQAWWWDAARADWFPVEPSLPLGRCYTHGITLRDGLLVLGGRKSTPDGRVSLRDAWWLRRQGGQFSWTQLPDMTTPRAIATIGHAGNRVLAMGGGEWEKSQGGAFATRHLTNYEVLDLDNPAAGWRDMGPLPFPSLVGSAFASVGDSLYVFGGYACWTEDNALRYERYGSAWRYDFPTDTWAQLADFPGMASGWNAVAYGEQIILLGGAVHVPVQGTDVLLVSHYTVEPGGARQRIITAYSDIAFVYDIATDEYRALADRLPQGCNDLRCAIAGNTIYVAGGETTDLALSNCSNVFLSGTIAEDDGGAP